MTRRFQLVAVLGVTVLACALCACGDESSKSGAEDGDDPFHNAGSDQSGSGGDSGTTSGTGTSGGTSSGDARDSGAGESPPDAGSETSGGGTGGSAMPGGSGGGSGTPGGTGGSGTPGGTGGSSGGTGGASGGPMGTLPIGALCANDGNCSQAMGEAVCCANSCELVQDCPDSTGYLPCNKGSDCQQFGGGKVCCELGPQRFCTKQSGCTGRVLP